MYCRKSANLPALLLPGIGWWWTLTGNRCFCCLWRGVQSFGTVLAKSEIKLLKLVRIGNTFNSGGIEIDEKNFNYFIDFDFFYLPGLGGAERRG